MPFLVRFYSFPQTLIIIVVHKKNDEPHDKFNL